MRSLKVVDLSGYSFTGKSAVYDLLSEFEGYRGGGKEFEFELIRMPGGILDLESALVSNWSPVRSSEAIRRFSKIVRNLGGNKSIPSRLFRLGAHYDYYFPGFSELSEAYIESLVQASWSADWPFAYYEYSQLGIFLRKAMDLIGRQSRYETQIFLSRISGAKFLELTQNFLMRLLSSQYDENVRSIVLNNALEPFCPEVGLTFLGNAKSIVVDRDPRDIYLSAMDYFSSVSPGVGRAVVGKDVDDFILRFKLYRSESIKANPGVLRLQFERLVSNYEDSVVAILSFLDEGECVHKFRKTAFDPDRSMINIGQWKRSDKVHLAAIKRIETELSAFCIDS